MRLMALIIAALHFLPPSAVQAGKGSLHMREGGAVFPPKGFREFCHRLPQDCDGVSKRPAVVAMTPKRIRQLEDVQRAVNLAVDYQSDAKTYGRSEYWAYPNGRGDCEDIALAKRQRLLDLGWPQETLLFGIGKLSNGQYHLVLIAVTEQGDLVLDSNAPDVRHWQDVPMRWVMRQTATNQKRWRKINAPRLPRVRPRLVSTPPLAVAGR